MSLIDVLLSGIPDEPVAVRDVRIGVHWTAVCSRGCGLAATYTGDRAHGSQRVRDVGYLHHKTAQELAGWLQSDNLLEASIGLAALNSLLPVDERRAVEINAFDLLAERGAGKKIAIVGHFPQVERLRMTAAEVWVLEKRPTPGDYPAEAAPELIPQADILAITGTTLINHTLEGLLALRQPHTLVMLLGPSTPLTPVLFEYGVDLLSGTQVVDETAVLLTIQQGAAFPQVKGTRLLTFSRAT
jgi:uncharacterized protein